MIINDLIQSIKKKGTPLVVGIDPHIELLPKKFINQFDYDSYPDQRSFYTDIILKYNEMLIQEASKLVPAVKFQISFFEQFGDLGYKALRLGVNEAKKNGLIVILDAKRGDIGSTTKGYCNSYFYNKLFREEAYLNIDILTVNPYLGFDTMKPFIDYCNEYNKGIFICLKTSNPGSDDIQGLELKNGQKLYKYLACKIQALIKPTNEYSSIGVVVGATYPDEARAIRKLLPNSYFLVPGLGSQNGDLNTIDAFLNPDGLGAIFNVSRGIAYHDIDSQDVQGSIQRNIKSYRMKLNNVICNPRLQ
jgi:orotidine-5'-phosphate decarboxylase